jgi:hypothetical protein
MPTAITHEPIFNTPASSTNTAVVRWSGTTGSTLQDCGVLIDGSNNITGIAGLTATQIDITGQGDLRLQDTTGGQYVALQANGTTTTHTLTLPAAQGSASTVLTNDGAGALTWAAGGGGAVTYAGGDVSETTTTSATPSNILSASVSIAATLPFTFVVNGRRATGNANVGVLGLSLNSTIINEAVESESSNNLWFADAASDDRNGMAHVVIGSRAAGYLDGILVGTGKRSAGGANTGSFFSVASRQDNPFVVETITTVNIRGASAGGATLGADELHVYSLATS